jgi:hypothetical protein
LVSTKPLKTGVKYKVLYRTNGVSIFSTTVQLPATHRKVEGGERDTQLVQVNEVNSCLALGYCVQYKPAQGEWRLSSPPHTAPSPPMAEFV